VQCSKDGEKPRRKRRSERASPPVFDNVVEVVALDRWRVHCDAAASVDALLEGLKAPVQVNLKVLVVSLEGLGAIRMGKLAELLDARAILHAAACGAESCLRSRMRQ